MYHLVNVNHFLLPQANSIESVEWVTMIKYCSGFQKCRNLSQRLPRTIAHRLHENFHSQSFLTDNVDDLINVYSIANSNICLMMVEELSFLCIFIYFVLQTLVHIQNRISLICITKEHMDKIYFRHPLFKHIYLFEEQDIFTSF